MRSFATIGVLFLTGGCPVFAQDGEHPLPYVEREPIYDVAPRFKDGSGAMMQYFKDSIRYPEPEWTQRKQGHVLVQFTISRKGAIKDIRVVNGVAGAPNLAREAERVIASMPPWIPATKNGKRVEAVVNISVPFDLGRNRR